MKKDEAKTKLLTDISERSKNVLGDIVTLYSQTGQPVGSKALCETGKLGLSSATIRNIMADLEQGGYLTSPHTSAGRVPTEEGFRFFAKSMVNVEDLEPEIKKAVEKRVLSGKPFKEMLADVSSMLEKITSCASLVVAPTLDNEKLEKIEFVRLKDNKVMAILVTDNGEIENRIINVPNKITEDKLNESAKYLKEIVAGKTLSDARVVMMQELMEQKRMVDDLMDDMMLAAEDWAEAPNTDSALVVAGTQNLFQYPELVREQLRGLFKTFEEKRLLMAVMGEVQKGQGVQIFIGSDCSLGNGADCSLIASSYSDKNRKIIGTLGVLGPIRMDYKKTISLVDYTGKLINKVLEHGEPVALGK